MILGVDHIALSCDDVLDGSKALERAGYQVIFADQNLRNDPSKRPFLKGYEPLHSLGYCRTSDGIAVELVQHSVPLQSTVSPYQVLLDGPPNAMPLGMEGLSGSCEIAWRAALGCVNPVAVLWEPFRAQVWYDRGRSESSVASVRAVLVSVAELEAAARFWTHGLGSYVTETGMAEAGHPWAKVSFQALLGRWSLDVVLLEDRKNDMRLFLDDAGFCCLGLITNRLAEDCAAAVAAGGQEAGEPFTILAGGKTLEIVILRGQANELIELIEFKHS